MTFSSYNEFYLVTIAIWTSVISHFNDLFHYTVLPLGLSVFTCSAVETTEVHMANSSL